MDIEWVTQMIEGEIMPIAEHVNDQPSPPPAGGHISDNE